MYCNFHFSFLLHVIVSSCSLYRSENLEEAENKFIVFKDNIPVFVEIAKDVSIHFLFKAERTLSTNGA